MLRRSENIAQLALAVARAQARYNALGKDRSANIASRSGAAYSYEYADLADTFDAIRTALTDEHIAVLQPMSMSPDGTKVIITTLLVHGDSGEWIEDDLAMPVSDPHDPRAIGSAGTYAKRYAVQSMTGIAPRGEDDDAETARGGAHEIATPRNAKLEVVPPPPRARVGERMCPMCGKDAIIKGRAEFGGGWVCYAKKGGCGYKWPEGPHPSELPPAVKPGTVPIEDAEREAEKLFPDERPLPEPIGKYLERNAAHPADIEHLVRRVQERFRMLPMSEAIRRKFWAEHVGPGVEFETAKGATLDGLWSLLNALGVQR